MSLLNDPRSPSFQAINEPRSAARRHHLLRACAAALLVGLLRQALAQEAVPPAPDVTRGERYDGLPPPRRTRDVLLFVPRLVLLLPRGLFYVLSVPSRHALEWNQRHHVMERALDLSTSKDGKIGVRPELDLTLDLFPTFGLTFFDDRVFGPDTSLQVSAATFGPSVVLVHSRLRPLPKGHNPEMDLRLSYDRRDDLPFTGIGPAGLSLPFARYASDELNGILEVTVHLHRLLRLALSGQLGLRRFGDGVSFGSDRPIRQVYSVAQVPGFVNGTQFMRFAAALRFDSRDNPVVPSSGVTWELEGDFTPMDRSDVASYFRVHGALGGVINLWRRRVLYLGASLRDVLKLGSQPVPFSELSTLGGPDDLRGFINGRFRDDASLFFTAEYRWPVWMWMDGTLFADYGGVFGANFSELHADNLRPDVGIGVRVRTQSRFIVRTQLAYGFGEGGGLRFVFAGTTQ